MGKRLICLLLCLCLLLPAVGCGYQKDGELVCPLPGAVSSLDPQTASGTAARLVIGSLFEGLCRLDENGVAVPGVAERWECDSTQTEYTFHLRKNASWSDGTPVTADDFRFAIERCLNPDTASPNADDLFLIQGARDIYNGEADLSSLGVAAEDDRTLVIRLERASSDFPAMTAALHYMPCNRAYFQESQGHYGLSSQYLLTNGPFALASIYAWQTDPGEREITLVRSENYRGEERVLPATLTYQMDYDDAIDQEPVSALTQGLADVLVLSQEQARLAEEEGCQVLALEDAVTGLLLNPQAAGLESPALREIFLKTLDRQSLLDRRGLEDPEEAQGVMPECVVCGGQPYYADGAWMIPQQDDAVVNGLSSLLDSLELEEMPSITVLCPDDQASIDVANGLLISWNEKLGNAFNIQPMPLSQLQSQVASGDYEAALYPLRAGGVTPYSVLQAFQSTASPALLEDPAYDQAFHTLAFDLSSYRSLEQQLLEEYVFYPLYRDRTYYGLSKNVRGITVSPDQQIDFTQALQK